MQEEKKIMEISDFNFRNIRHDKNTLQLLDVVEKTLKYQNVENLDCRDKENHKSHLEAGQKELCGFYLPVFQRGEVWTMDQKINLIEALFRGCDVGLFITTLAFDPKNILSDYLLLDGQQRFVAIRDFAFDKFSIFNDIYCSDILADKIVFNHEGPKKTSSAKILMNRINLHSYRIMYESNDDSLLREIYDQMNFSGTAHAETDRATNAGNYMGMSL